MHIYNIKMCIKVRHLIQTYFLGMDAVASNSNLDDLLNKLINHIYKAVNKCTI